MSTTFSPRHLRFRALIIVLVLSIYATALALNASAQEASEFDSYKVKLTGDWVYSSPSGTFRGINDATGVDLQRDLRFNSYSTFVGKLDWKFTHKNHFYVMGIPFNSSRDVVLNRTIVFQGQTFVVGLSVHASLNSPMYVFGYQYDIIRRRRGHLGLGVQANVFDTRASVKAAAQVTGDGMHHAAISASGSLVAPVPVAGPEFRLYLTNSPRLFLDGNVYGMYFFGYGNFISAAGSLGLTLLRHLTVNAGYQMGSRLVINNDSSTSRIGLSMTQRGPLAGLQLSF
jgi:hypothetical protein